MGQQTQLIQRCNDKLNISSTATKLELPNHATRATQVRTSHGETHAERSELLSTSAPRCSQTCARGWCGACWGSLLGETACGAKRCLTSLRKPMCERQRARPPACASEASPLPRSTRATASPPRCERQRARHFLGERQRARSPECEWSEHLLVMSPAAALSSDKTCANRMAKPTRERSER